MRRRCSSKPCGAQPSWIFSWHDDEYASVNRQLDNHLGETETVFTRIPVPYSV